MLNPDKMSQKSLKERNPSVSCRLLEMAVAAFFAWGSFRTFPFLLEVIQEINAKRAPAFLATDWAMVVYLPGCLIVGELLWIIFRRRLPPAAFKRMLLWVILIIAVGMYLMRHTMAPIGMR